MRMGIRINARRPQVAQITKNILGIGLVGRLEVNTGIENTEVQELRKGGAFNDITF